MKMSSSPATPPSLNECQTRALRALKSDQNVFLTGGAGSGKSFLIRHYLSQVTDDFPILASTGSAAILVGGRTFHSFFGLGIMEGGVEKTVEKAVKNRRVNQRLRAAKGVIIDEISMIPGQALRAAEEIARKVREKPDAWGGLRVIAVGDFSQLPPVSRGAGAKDWAFLDQTWRRSQFVPALLRTMMRTQDPEFLRVLNWVRDGQINGDVKKFLESRLRAPDGKPFDGTRMFPLRRTTEEHNLSELEKLPGDAHEFHTEYSGKKDSVEDMKKNAPVPEIIRLKKGALVMIRQNDPDGRWVNGTLGTAGDLDAEKGELEIELKNGMTYRMEPTTFHLLDADGERVASATNFPITLAYATTIHKAQGTTLDKIWVDLRNLWEPGQAYVALSRVRTKEDVFLVGWSPRSFHVDPLVADLYVKMEEFLTE
jgi:ATP-dependent exoDNAse (exonuclease V) alpha subunit